MRGRYLVQSHKAAAVLTLADAALAPLGAIARLRRVPERTPRRLLVACWAHLGDVVLALPAVAALRDRLPETEIGILCGSWSAGLVKGTGLADGIHTADHWILQDRSRPLRDRLSRYYRQRPALVRALRAAGYDAAIDLYPFFPPAAPLFFAAGIPRRLGFSSGGLSTLLTHPVSRHGGGRHMIDQARDLLAHLPGVGALPPGALRPVYPGQPAVPLPARVAAQAPRGYTVVHMGTRARFKEWPEENWRRLLAALSARGIACVLTGVGDRETARARSMLAEPGAGVIEATGCSWDEFVAIVAGAERAVCVDSVIGHVAACFAVPTVTIFSGTIEVAQWRPLSDVAVCVTAPVGCAPCNRPGCAAMACVREVTPDAVLAALDGLRGLPRKTP